MKAIKALLFIVMFSLAGNAFASDGAQREAEKLLNTMGMEESLNRTIETMLNLQLQQKPNLAPYKDIMMKFFMKHMSYKAIKSDLVDIYCDAFTESELKALNAFYQSSAGKKSIRIMPELVQKGGQLGVRKMQLHAYELQEMIRVESERIQLSQGQ